MRTRWGGGRDESEQASVVGKVDYVYLRESQAQCLRRIDDGWVRLGSLQREEECESREVEEKEMDEIVVKYLAPFCFKC